jgi:hypothetical protein
LPYWDGNVNCFKERYGYPCGVISASPQPSQMQEEEDGVGPAGAAAASGMVLRRRYLAKFREMVAYCMHVPSAILMNVVWR